MPAEMGQKFRDRLRAAEQRLKAIDESSAAEPYYPEKWTRKQVLGHLLDSAANNHIRFVVAALEGKYSGPNYHSDGWVQLHGYNERGWTALLDRWRDVNAVLNQVVERIPEERLGAQCIIGDGKPVTLRFVIEDYLDHLDQHVADITK